MKILSFDPGYSTGFTSLFLRDHKISHLYSETILVHNLREFVEDFATPKNCRIVIEDTPEFGRRDSVVYEAFDILIKVYKYRAVTLVTPSQWKPVSKAKKWSNPIAVTQHERDSFCMLAWLIYSEFKMVLEV